MKKIVTTANTDLNDYKENGIYYFSVSMKPTNIPTGSNGWLQVMNIGNTSVVKQIWLRHGTVNTNDFETYVRILNDTAGWSEWRKLQIEPTVLYNNSSGTNGNVTLSETANNFQYLEIFYKSNDSTPTYNSTKVSEPNNKNACLSVMSITDNQIYKKEKIVKISGTTISNVSNAEWSLTSTATTFSKANNVYIVKVLGYK